MYVRTVVQEIYVFRNFRVKIFSWSGGYHEIYYHDNLYTLRNYIEKMEDYKRDLYVRSFHVYRDIWEAAVGEVLDCEREPGNAVLCCVYIYVDCTTCYYSLLKIFRVTNFRGLSQPLKYFNNENFPNYGMSLTKLPTTYII